MRIRRAAPEEAGALTQIAHDAKRHWGYPEHWIQHWQAELTLSPDYIANSQVYVGEQEGELMGFYALAIKENESRSKNKSSNKNKTSEDKAELEHLWVAPKHIGTGVGKELFIHAMQRAAGQNLSEVDISSDPNAEGFYRRMGAKRIGEVVSEIDGQARLLPHLKIDPSGT